MEERKKERRKERKKERKKVRKRDKLFILVFTLHKDVNECQ